MAIYINGTKVAGRVSSPYQIAVKEGFSGTEQKFNQSLAEISTISNKIDEVKNSLNQDVIVKYGVDTLETIHNAINAKNNVYVEKTYGSSLTKRFPLSSYELNGENLIACNFNAVDHSHINEVIRLDINEDGQEVWSTNNPTYVHIDSNVTGTDSCLRGIIVSTNEPTAADSGTGNNGDIWIVYSN